MFVDGEHVFVNPNILSTPQIDYNDEELQVIRDDDILMVYGDVQDVTKLIDQPEMTLSNSRMAKDYVLLKVEKEQLVTQSGIAIAASVVEGEPPCVGQVVMCGEGRTSSLGTNTGCVFKIGERLKFREYAGNEVEMDGVDYVAVRFVEVLSRLPSHS